MWRSRSFIEPSTIFTLRSTKHRVVGAAPFYKSHFAKNRRSQVVKNEVTAEHNMGISMDRVVLVDMDNTVVDYDLEFGKRWMNAHPSNTLDQIKLRKHFELEQNFSADLKPIAVEIMSKPGFFMSFQPTPYAVEALQEMEAAGLSVFLCTAPSPMQWETCVAEKYGWVRKNLGEDWMKRIVVTRDKTLVKGKVLVDDKPKVVGVVEKPDWVHVVYDQPYNRNVEDRLRLTDWHKWRDVIGKHIDL